MLLVVGGDLLLFFLVGANLILDFVGALCDRSYYSLLVVDATLVALVIDAAPPLVLCWCCLLLLQWCYVVLLHKCSILPSLLVVF
jgi:hypothetical protein